MTLEQAITIAAAANRWRRSETDEPMPNPKDLGVAIDTLVAFASKFNQQVALLEKICRQHVKENI